MPLAQDDLQATFAPEYLRRGEEYQLSGRVLQVDYNRRRGLVTARVDGNARRPYDVIARLVDSRSGRRDVLGQCSCPIGFNCKHVAAALLELIDRDAPPTRARGPGLPRGLADWVQGLAEAARRSELAQRTEIHYVLERHRTEGNLALTVTPVVLVRYGAGLARVHQPERSDDWSPPALDRWLMDALSAASVSVQPPWCLDEPMDPHVLEELIATRRCFWRELDTPALRIGPTAEAELSWATDRQGRQRLSFGLGDARVVLPTEPPWYVDTQDFHCGPVVCELDDAVAAVLASAPELTPDHAEPLRAALADTLEGVPLPQARETHERTCKPVPCLALHGGSPPSRVLGPRAYFSDPSTTEEAYALVSFEYAGVAVALTSPADTVTRDAGSHVERLPRQRSFENRAADRLDQAGLALMYPAGESADVYVADAPNTSWAEVIDRLVPELRGEGWRVHIAKDFPYRVIDAEQWYASVDDADERDWFALELGIDIDGRRVNLVPALAEWLRSLPAQPEALDAIDDDEPTYVDLGDGDIARVPAARVKPIVKTLLELYRPDALDDEGRVHLHRLRAHRVVDLDETMDVDWRGAEHLRRLARALATSSGPKRSAVPRGLRAELRAYQRDGLDWLQFLRRNELGGILADDMGLGKTLQTLASLLLEKERARADAPSLVIAPTSVLGTWRNEAERFAPKLEVGVLHGPQRHGELGELSDYDLIITSYALVTRDYDTLVRQRFHYLILDEAQHVKNPKAKAAQAVRGLEARHRLCLTGTPIENHLGELWAQMDFLLPGMLGDDKRFRALFRRPIERDGDKQRETELRRRVAPFLLRRTKEQVAAELPAKTEIVQPVTLEGGQRDLYESVRAAMHQRVRREIDDKGIERSHIVILDALLKLRQVCCDPRLVKLSSAKNVKRTAKLDQLAELLTELVDEGRRVLVFSQFAQMLGLIEERLTALDIDYLKLTGQTRKRQERIDRFQAGEAPVFLISLKAGGTGLNLTAADTVIHYDPWWNPAVEAQAVDRAHRIGQDKPVFVYRLIAEGTVEERIQKLQLQKRALADALYEDSEQAAAQLSREDLEQLLEPLE